MPRRKLRVLHTRRGCRYRPPGPIVSARVEYERARARAVRRTRPSGRVRDNYVSASLPPSLPGMSIQLTCARLQHPIRTAPCYYYYRYYYVRFRLRFCPIPWPSRIRWPPTTRAPTRATLSVYVYIYICLRRNVLRRRVFVRTRVVISLGTRRLYRAPKRRTTQHAEIATTTNENEKSSLFHLFNINAIRFRFIYSIKYVRR